MDEIFEIVKRRNYWKRICKAKEKEVPPSMCFMKEEEKTATTLKNFSRIHLSGNSQVLVKKAKTDFMTETKNKGEFSALQGEIKRFWRRKHDKIRRYRPYGVMGS